MTRRKTRAAARRTWDIAHFIQLAHKFDYFSAAWGDDEPTAETLNDMRICYRKHGDEIEDLVRRQHGPRAKSWAAENLFG